MTAVWIRRGQPLKTLEKQAPIWGGGKSLVRDMGRGGWARGYRANTYVHLGGRGEPVAGRSLRGREGVRAKVAPSPHLPSSSVAPLTSGSSWCFMVAQAVGSSGGLSAPGRGGGRVPAGTDLL